MRIDQICDGSASNCPAVNASGEETRRTPERPQANLHRVYGMQSSKTLDQLTAQQRADLGPAGQARRQSVADYHPRAVLDDLERRAEHARVVAEEHGPRG